MHYLATEMGSTISIYAVVGLVVGVPAGIVVLAGAFQLV
jgi:hypothetical protein